MAGCLGTDERSPVDPPGIATSQADTFYVSRGSSNEIVFKIWVSKASLYKATTGSIAPPRQGHWAHSHCLTGRFSLCSQLTLTSRTVFTYLNLS